MKLYRLAVLTWSPRPMKWEPFGIRRGDVALAMREFASPPGDANELVTLVRAETQLHRLPCRDTSGYLAIPDDSRRSSEEAIEFVANLVAVAGRCKKSINSPVPPAALIAEGPGEQTFLDESVGVRLAPVFTTGARPAVTIDDELAASLLDRAEGLSLMAEALSHTQCLGKYRDFVRVIELAFALPITRLEKKLAVFLLGANLGYERAEIARWVSLRHGASHADKQKTRDIVLEADVRPLIMRIEQATIDVLFNKKHWHNKSTERRELFRPNAATSSRSGSFRLLRGNDAQLQIQLLDEFGVYPYFTKDVFQPPDEWWWKPLDAPLASGTLEVSE